MNSFYTQSYTRRQQGGMEEAPENGNESSHSAHANGKNEMNEYTRRL
jgi:hypothetical protein